MSRFSAICIGPEPEQIVTVTQRPCSAVSIKPTGTAALIAIAIKANAIRSRTGPGRRRTKPNIPEEPNVTLQLCRQVRHGGRVRAITRLDAKYAKVRQLSQSAMTVTNTPLFHSPRRRYLHSARADPITPPAAPKFRAHKWTSPAGARLRHVSKCPNAEKRHSALKGCL